MYRRAFIYRAANAFPGDIQCIIGVTACHATNYVIYRVAWMAELALRIFE
jgi:hypothetical protein